MYNWNVTSLTAYRAHRQTIRSDEKPIFKADELHQQRSRSVIAFPKKNAASDRKKCSPGSAVPLKSLNMERLNSLALQTQRGCNSLTYSGIREVVSGYTDTQLSNFITMSNSSEWNKKPGFFYAIVEEIYYRLDTGKSCL